jgi:hypothetical protein
MTGKSVALECNNKMIGIRPLLYWMLMASKDNLWHRSGHVHRLDVAWLHERKLHPIPAHMGTGAMPIHVKAIQFFRDRATFTKEGVEVFIPTHLKLLKTGLEEL